MEARKCRILVADDEPIERKVVCKNIQNYFGDAVEICQAANGFEALEIFRQKKCEIALLDITMPGMNGLDAADEIRRMSGSCSIIFLTAYDEFEYAKRAIRVHALDYLLKPGTKEELIAVLEEAVHLSGSGGKAKTGRDGQMRKEEIRDDRADSIRNQAFKEQIYDYIEKHYMEDISLQDAAAQLNYSDPYFCRFFKQNFDKNFIMYLSELRVEKAKALLSDMTVNIRDIGQRVGFRDSSYFAKVFKRITGETPSEYRYSGQDS